MQIKCKEGVHYVVHIWHAQMVRFLTCSSCRPATTSLFKFESLISRSNDCCFIPTVILSIWIFLNSSVPKDTFVFAHQDNKRNKNYEHERNNTLQSLWVPMQVMSCWITNLNKFKFGTYGSTVSFLSLSTKDSFSSWKYFASKSLHMT